MISPTLGGPSANFKVMDACFGHLPATSHHTISGEVSQWCIFGKNCTIYFKGLSGVLPVVCKKIEGEARLCTRPTQL